jgi:transcriptional regulator with XRE-family HTH domain
MCPLSYSGGMTDNIKTSARRSRRPRASREPTGPHANRIGQMRERVGLTQSEVIAASGLSESYYKKLESGRRPVTAEVLVVLSPILQCQPGDMVEPDADDVTQEQLLLAQFRLMAPDNRDLILATARRFAG